MTKQLFALWDAVSEAGRVEGLPMLGKALRHAG